MAKAFELEGSVKVIFDEQTFPSGFSKREFVLEVEDGNYPQMIKFECIKDKASMLDSLSTGDRVTVHFDIRGNEYKERYFVNLSAWKVTKSGDEAGPGDASLPDGAAGPADPASPPEEEADDIPF